MHPNESAMGRSVLSCVPASVALALVLALGPSTLRAEAGAKSPSFSAPLDVSNRFVVFVPGAVKVFSGREGGEPVTLVQTQLRRTRAFDWQGTLVTCAILEDLKFLGGVPAGREEMYIAQADDGSVWSFGEVEDDEPDDDDADDEEEPGGWIVGARSASDPEDVVTGAQPALYMPADPQIGDEWMLEDAPPEFVKTSRVERTAARVSTGAGRHTECLRVLELDIPDGTTETRWFAPGAGLVGNRERGGRLALTASTIRPRR